MASVVRLLTVIDEEGTTGPDILTSHVNLKLLQLCTPLEYRVWRGVCARAQPLRHKSICNLVS